jgi:cupin 2 domain-containing protein
MVRNIFRDVTPASKEPQVTTIAENRNIKIQRVVASGQSSKAGLFCPQEDNDLLVLLQGNLILDYENGRRVNMAAGDYIFTAPKENNRVAETSHEEETIWIKFSFHGQTSKGLFPSPDLKKIKEKLKRNVFSNTAMIESLIESKEVRIERVVSIGQHSAGGSCEQPFSEFVYVMKGQTVLEVGEEKASMGPGDYLNISPEVPNRVAWTAEGAETIWLGVYYNGEAGKGSYPFQTGYTKDAK